MASKAQLQKKYADALSNSTAPTALLQALYALSKDKTLQGADLISYGGWKGKRPSGRQIALAKQLLGIRNKTTTRNRETRPKTVSVDSPAKHIEAAIASYKTIVATANQAKQQAKKEYQARLAAIEAATKEARKNVSKLKTMAAGGGGMDSAG